jgi:hypothetical protein
MKPIQHLNNHAREPDAPSGLAETRPRTWLEPTTPADLRVEIRTPQALVLDLRAHELIVDDWVRPLRAVPGCRPFLGALTGGSLLVRTPDGVGVHVEFGWGTLACDGGQARISTSRAVVHAIADEHRCCPASRARRGQSSARRAAVRTPHCPLPAPAVA